MNSQRCERPVECYKREMQVRARDRRLTEFACIRILLDNRANRVDERLLVLKASLVAQHRRKEDHHRRMLARIARAERANRLDNDDFKLVAYLRDEAADLLHETLDGRFAARFE